MIICDYMYAPSIHKNAIAQFYCALDDDDDDSECLLTNSVLRSIHKFFRKTCLLFLFQMTTRRSKKLLYVKERKAKFAARQTTRSEILHVEEEG